MEAGVGLLPCAEQTSVPHISYSHKFPVHRQMFLPLYNHPLRDQELHLEYIDISISWDHTVVEKYFYDFKEALETRYRNLQNTAHWTEFHWGATSKSILTPKPIYKIVKALNYEIQSGHTQMSPPPHTVPTAALDKYNITFWLPSVKLGVNISYVILYKLPCCITDNWIWVLLFGCHGCQEMARLQW